MIGALGLLLGAGLALAGLVAWRNREWRLVGRDKYTPLGRVKVIPEPREGATTDAHR